MASQPARCSTGATILPSSSLVFLDGMRWRDQLLARVRMLAFGEPGELLRVHGAGKTVFLGQLAMPLANDGVALLPVVLLGRQ